MISGFITLLHTKRFHFKSLGLELLQAASSSELMTCMIYNTVSAAAAAAAAVTAAGGWGFFCPKVLPTGKTCLLSQVVGTLTIPLGYFPTVVGVPYVSPTYGNELHTSAFECYGML